MGTPEQTNFDLKARQKDALPSGDDPLVRTTL